MPSIADKFGKASIDTDYAIATTVENVRAPGATVLEAIDVSKFPDDTPAFFVTYQKTTNPTTGEVTVSNLVSWKGLVNVGANTITNLTLAPGYVDDGNEEGDFIEMIPTSYWNTELIDGLLTSLNPDGTIKNDAVGTAQIAASAVDTAELADSAVETAKINNAAVTPSKLGLAPQTAIVVTGQTTTSAGTVDLATVGPTVTVDVGANGLVLLLVQCSYTNSTIGEGGGLFYSVSGATTVSDVQLNVSSRAQRAATVHHYAALALISGLTPGSNTIKLRYGANTGGTSTYANRTIVAIPL